MKINAQKINITPDKTLFPKLGQAGYSISEALAELIDNSVDARDEKVIVDVSIDKNKDKIIIEDNGVGMSKETAINSVILAKSSKKEGELGQFGIGLKTSCMSLGRKFRIETSTRGSDEMYIIEFDEKEWMSNGDWELEIKTKSNVEKNKSGTKIIISELRIKFYPNLINNIKRHLSDRFAPFIANGELRVKLNKKIIKAEPPIIIENSKKTFEIILNNGQKITGWSGILERGSMEESGFNLYRYNRLIRAHEKLGYVYHPSKMWVTGEIHLDPIPVTHNKREFITTDPLYAEFFEKFKEILKGILADAQRRHREEKIKDLPKHLRETLKNSLLKAINRTDDLKELAFPTQDIKKRSKTDEGEELEKETRDIAESDDNRNDQDTMDTKNRTPNKRSAKKAKFITIAGHRYQFDYQWNQLDENIAKESYLDRDKNMIMVILNSKYHLLNVVKVDMFYLSLYLSEGIVEVFLKENNHSLDRLTSLRDKLMKSLADVISDDIEEKVAEKDNQMIEAQSYLLGGKKEIYKKLTVNEKEALKLRLEENATYDIIAKKLKVSRQRADQLFHSALNKINATPPRDHITEISDDVVDEKLGRNIEEIINGVSEAYNLETELLLGKSRKQELILPRHMIAYKLRNQLGMSFPKIGNILKRDHTTIIYAVRNIEKRIK